MFNKKKFQRLAEAYQASSDALMKASLKKLEDARALADAGDRYAAFASLGAAAKEKQKEIADGFEKEAYHLDWKTSGLKVGGFTASSLAAFGGTLAVVAFPLVAAATAAVSAGCFVASALAAYKKNTRFSDQARTKTKIVHEEFRQFLAEVNNDRDAILNAELKGIAASPRFNELYKLPDVKFAFDRAVARETMLNPDRHNKLDKKKFKP